MKTVIIVPTFNERGNIRRLISRLSKIFSQITGHQFEILVVDDNSPDGTADIVRQMMRRKKNVKLLIRKKREGLGAAYLAGMKEAFGPLRANIVIIMDADLSHNPRYLLSFLEAIEQGADLVIGSRYISGGAIPKNWRLHRKFFSVFGNIIVPLMLGKRDITDWTSGYRALNKKVYKKIAPRMARELGSKGYTFNISFAYYSLISGFRVGEVPIEFIDRKSGKSKLGLEYLFYTPIFLFKTRLKLFGKGIV